MSLLASADICSSAAHGGSRAAWYNYDVSQPALDQENPYFQRIIDVFKRIDLETNHATTLTLIGTQESPPSLR